MKKTYFIQFDFWGDKFNKFYYGIINVDLNNTSITEACRDIIKKEFGKEISHKLTSYDAITIKVNALNNIDL